METEALIELLERHGIKSTPNRILVASTLEEASRPLSMTEIEETIGTIDKSSVFRTLSLFRESHLVHAFEDGSDVVRYELCMSESNEDDDTQETEIHAFDQGIGAEYVLVEKIVDRHCDEEHEHYGDTESGSSLHILRYCQV